MDTLRRIEQPGGGAVYVRNEVGVDPDNFMSMYGHDWTEVDDPEELERWLHGAGIFISVKERRCPVCDRRLQEIHRCPDEDCAYNLVER